MRIGKRMKRIVALLLCALTAVVAASCSADVPESGEKEYTVTFIQNGIVVHTLKVVDGFYTDILPEIQPKTGYYLKWSKTDFGDITGDTTVTVVETPKTYRITLNPDGGAFADDNSTENKTVSVTYDATYSLPECKKDGYKFVSWKIDENRSCPSAGKWATDKDLTLNAAYELIETEKFKVRFVQHGEEDVVIEVEKGKKLSDIPSPKEVKGYDVSWDTVNLEDMVITGHLTVNAVSVPKTYTVTFKYNGKETTKTATYGKKFTLLEVDGVDSWYIEGKMSNYSGEITEWSFDTDITFIADKIVVEVVVDDKDKNKTYPAVKTRYEVDKNTDIGKLLEFPNAGADDDYWIYAYKGIVDGVEIMIKQGDSYIVKSDLKLTIVLSPAWVGPY